MNLKILVVDDQKNMRDYVATLLKGNGFKDISFAENGEEAWNKLYDACSAEIPFHLILSDLRMPELDGVGLLKKVREFSPSSGENHFFEELANTPFIVCTAEGDTESMMSILENGADNYLVKPFTKDALKEKIVTVMEKRKINIEN